MTDVSRQTDLEKRLAGLSPEKRALLEKRLLGRQAAEEIAPPISPREEAGPAPLSFVQELMWLVHELTPGMHTYNSSGARRLYGPVDVDALERAINGVVTRHSSLRTTFEVQDGAPVQIIHEDIPVHLDVVDAPGIGADDLAERLRGLFRTPFDLSVPLLFRATLIRIAPEDHVLVTSANHIVWDGWSKGIYFRELAEFYDAYCTGREPVLPELPVQYVDFAVWQRTWLSGERMQRQLDFWRDRLAGAPPLLELPTDRPRPATQSYLGDRVSLWLEPEELQGLKALAQGNGATLFMLLVGAWSAFLHRYTGQDEIVLGTPIAGRNRVEVEGLIGYFNNTLALRVDLSGDPTFTELLARVRDMALGAYANQDVSFEHVVREVAPQRDMSYSPVFQSLIVLQNASSEAALQLRGLEMDIIQTDGGTSKFDLSIGMGEHDGRLHASFEYASDLFDRETVERLRDHVGRMVGGLLADPTQRISQLPLLDDAERAALVAAAAGPRRPIPDTTLHGMVADRAALTPDAVAVVSSSGELRYAELRQRAGRLAAALRARGIGRGSCVGLCLERTPELVVALLGILEAGAACVPLDPEYPRERLEAMIEDAQVAVVVADGEHAALVAGLGAQVQDPRADDAPAGDPPSDAGPGDAAYVIFTSGSTGRPKGVVLEHRGLVNHALAAGELFGMTPQDRTLQFSSISFDISLEEIFCTLCSGATLVLRDADMPLGGPGFVEWLEERRVSFLDLPTAFWHEWVRDLDERRAAPPSTLRLVVVGGEKASAEVHDTWRRVAPGVRWINTYGPTEGTVIATLFEPGPDWRRDPGAELPIGRPLPNVDVHVLDRHGSVVPVGVRGELHIGGAGVARGYLGLPESTAERFVTLPGSGERVYATGDVVRRRADGLVEFVGRNDDQIKLRGFRIEPAEVEEAVLAHPAVSAAMVMLRGERDPALVAYVLPEPGGPAPEEADVRRFAAERLPAFAVPSAVVLLEAFPLTRNGKVDRDALPAPAAGAAVAAVREPPRDETERVLVEIWSELLGTEVGTTEDFFELGGHSMMAVRMLTQVEARLGHRLRLGDMVRAPTIRALGERLSGRSEEDDRGALVRLKPDGARPPLFLVHSLTGDVLIYRDLVRRLHDDQPAWGLEAIGIDGEAVPMRSIPDMAAHYVEKMRTVQPRGPYLMAGLCYGGAVAHEMAHQLEQAGDEVAFVGLIDANPLGVKKVKTVRERVAEHALELREMPASEWPAFLRSTGANVSERTRKQLRRRVRKHLYINRGRALPPGLTDMLELNAAASAGYVSPRYGGRVTLFRVHDPDEDRSGKVQDLRLRWQEFAAGGLDVRDVTSSGAGHISVLFEPHVGPLSEALETALTDAVDGRGA